MVIQGQTVQSSNFLQVFKYWKLTFRTLNVWFNWYVSLIKNIFDMTASDSKTFKAYGTSEVC